MSELVCVVDLGSTSIKAALVDSELCLTAVAHRPAPALHDDGMSFDAAAMVDAAFAAIREVAGTTGAVAGQVQAMALTNQRATIVPIDGEGLPVGPAMSWQGSVGGDAVTRFFDDFDPLRYRRITGLPPSGMWSLAKILHFRGEAAPPMVSTPSWATVHDLFLRCLGAEQLVSDRSNACATGMYDIHHDRWSDEILDAAGIRREVLPAILPAGTRVGALGDEAARRSGLPPGIPLLVGGGDQQCAALGAGALDSGRAVLCLGTAAIISCPVDAPLVVSDSPALCTCHVAAGRWVAEAIHNSFGSTLDWVANLLGVDSPLALERIARDAPAGARGAVFLPFLAGLGSPEFEPQVRAGLTGVTLGHGRAEVARAAFEGVVLELRRILESLSPYVAVDRLSLVGGGSEGALLSELLVAVLDRPLDLLDHREASLVGVAAVAWTGLGRFSSLADAAARCIGHARPLVSSASAGNGLNQRYLRAREAIRALALRRD